MSENIESKKVRTICKKCYDVRYTTNCLCDKCHTRQKQKQKNLQEYCDRKDAKIYRREMENNPFYPYHLL